MLAEGAARGLGQSFTPHLWGTLPLPGRVGHSLRGDFTAERGGEIDVEQALEFFHEDREAIVVFHGHKICAAALPAQMQGM